MPNIMIPYFSEKMYFIWNKIEYFVFIFVCRCIFSWLILRTLHSNYFYTSDVLWLVSKSKLFLQQLVLFQIFENLWDVGLHIYSYYFFNNQINIFFYQKKSSSFLATEIFAFLGTTSSGRLNRTKDSIFF